MDRLRSITLNAEWNARGSKNDFMLVRCSKKHFLKQKLLKFYLYLNPWMNKELLEREDDDEEEKNSTFVYIFLVLNSLASNIEEKLTKVK